MYRLLTKYKSYPMSVKAVFWFLVCNVILKGIGFISVPLFAEILPESEYGILSLYMSYQTIIVSLCTWEIHNGAYQKGLYIYKDNERQFTAASQAFLWILTTGIFIILFVLQNPVKSITGYTDESLLAIYVYIMLLPGFSFWMTRKRNEYRYKPVVIISILESFLIFIIPFFAVYFIDATADVKYVSALLIECLMNLFFIGYGISPKLIKDRVKVREIWRFLVRFQLPLLPHAFSYYILTQADRIMIGKMEGEVKTAYYSIAYNVAASVAIVQAALNQAILPWTYKKLENKGYYRIKEISLVVLLLLGGVMTIFGLIAPDLLRILFSESYYNAVWCIPPIVMSLFFNEIYCLFVNILSYYEKTYYITYASAICGGVNIVFNYLGIQYFGYTACAYTTFVCYILMAILCYFFTKKVCKSKKIAVNDIYNIHNITIMGIVVTGIMISMALLYCRVVERYVVIFVLFVFGYVEFKKFMRMKSQD